MSQLKQQGINILRQTGMLGSVERLHGLWSQARSRSDNLAFLKEHPDFVPPPAAAMHDAYSSVSYRDYWSGGDITARYLADIIRQYHPVCERVAEWGCGPARVLRHLPHYLPEAKAFYGTDYNKQSIEWCQKHLPGITFATNDLAPSLPFGSQFLDVIYAISVLTHLSVEQQDAWMRELRRVLKPGGCLILSTHGEHCAKILLPQEQAQLKRDGVVIRSGVEEGKRCYVSYHSADYARNHLFKGMKIMAHLPDNGVMRQDIWVLQ